MKGAQATDDCTDSRRLWVYAIGVSSAGETTFSGTPLGSIRPGTRLREMFVRMFPWAGDPRELPRDWKP